jgi:glycosyltransferase involved in cell wall biosynthesis
MPMNRNRPDLAIFLATSGHSGVDRVMRNLVPELSALGLRMDLLHVRGHGPHWTDLPAGARVVDLGASHVSTSLPALVRYLRRNRPAALLSDKDKVNRTALLARRLAGVDTRVAIRVGTTVTTNLERRGWWARYSEYASIRLFYRFADAIITPSKGAAEDLAAIAGLPVNRVTVIPNPVLNETMQRKADQPIDHPWFAGDGPPVILGVGELCARKDFSTLLRAFAKLRSARPCRLVIVGRGRQREALLSLAHHLGVAEDVDLLGFLDNPYPYMRKADLFALTSKCEGLPVVLIEALALGTPAVATDCPSGPREILRDGRYGPLVAVGDVEALAEQLMATLDHPLSRETLLQAALPYAATSSAQAYRAVLGFSGLVESVHGA